MLLVNLYWMGAGEREASNISGLELANLHGDELSSHIHKTGWRLALI